MPCIADPRKVWGSVWLTIVGMCTSYSIRWPFEVTNASRSCAVSGIFQHQVTFTCHMWCLSRGLWTGLVGHVPLSLFTTFYHEGISGIIRVIASFYRNWWLERKERMQKKLRTLPFSQMGNLLSRKQCAEANARAHYLKQLHWLAAANSGKVNLQVPSWSGHTIHVFLMNFCYIDTGKKV